MEIRNRFMCQSLSLVNGADSRRAVVGCGCTVNEFLEMALRNQRIKTLPIPQSCTWSRSVSWRVGNPSKKY